MIALLKGKVVELGVSEYNGKEFPFAKVFCQYGAKTDLVRVSLAEKDGIKVGQEVEWPIVVDLAEGERGKRMTCKRSV